MKFNREIRFIHFRVNSLHYFYAALKNARSDAEYVSES